MLLMAEMIFHLTFEHGLKNGAKNLLQDVLYVFRALDVVVVEDLLSNLLAWGSWWSFTLCHSVTVLIFVYPSMGHKVDSCNTDLHKLFWFFTLFCGIKIITYKIGIEKEHYLLQNVSCLKLRTEVE